MAARLAPLASWILMWAFATPSFGAAYRGEVRLEPAEADSWIGLAAVKPSVQAMNSEVGERFLLGCGRGFLGAGLGRAGLDGSQGVRMEFAPPPPSSSGRSLVSLVPKTSGRSDKVRGTSFQSWSNRYG